MSEYTLTTEDIRIACEMALSGLYPNASRREAFNRWLGQVKAEAWDEGFSEGVNHDLGDWENAPSIINNPYRQEEK